MTTPEEFLKTLWGEIPPGKVLIWTLPDKKSRWYAHFDTITADMRFHEYEDVYTGIGLAPWEGMRLASNKRLREWEVAAITAFWADIDVAHPVHKKSEQLPPSIERAMEAIAQLPFEATIIVNSGHGLQLWWVLKEVWTFRRRRGTGAGPEGLPVVAPARQGDIRAVRLDRGQHLRPAPRHAAAGHLEQQKPAGAQAR